MVNQDPTAPYRSKYLALMNAEKFWCRPAFVFLFVVEEHRMKKQKTGKISKLQPLAATQQAEESALSLSTKPQHSKKCMKLYKHLNLLSTACAREAKSPVQSRDILIGGLARPIKMQMPSPPGFPIFGMMSML